MLKDWLTGVVNPSRGPHPNFFPYHVVVFLYLLDHRGRIGRQRVSSAFHLGEATARTMIMRLKKDGVIEVDRRGCTLTGKGREILNHLSGRIQFEFSVRSGTLSVGEISSLVAVKDAASKVSTGLIQRDAAVGAGALGATTLVMKGGELVVPPEGKISDIDNARLKVLKHDLFLKEGDVLIIGTGKDELEAAFGAWAAALSLI